MLSVFHQLIAWHIAVRHAEYHHKHLRTLSEDYQMTVSLVKV